MDELEKAKEDRLESERLLKKWITDSTDFKGVVEEDNEMFIELKETAQGYRKSAFNRKVILISTYSAKFGPHKTAALTDIFERDI